MATNRVNISVCIPCNVILTKEDKASINGFIEGCPEAAFYNDEENNSAYIYNRGGDEYEKEEETRPEQVSLPRD